MRLLPVSPDGKYIAFTGEYDGNREVYLMPAEGGNPVRLTYTPVLARDDISDRMGPNNLVIGWTPDGQKIVYRSARLNGTILTASFIWSRKMEDFQRNCHCRVAVFALFHRMVRSWLLTGFSVNSAPGKDTGAAWLMMSGSTILKTRRLKI
jgi:hypothetical protein